MLYDFSHFPTETGRRVVCVLDAEDYRRATARVARPYFDGVLREQVDGGLYRVTLTVPAAIRLREALAVVGGDAAATARMLEDQLDYMAEEVGRERATASPLPPAAPLFAATV